jgi:hypothetical protein
VAAGFIQGGKAGTEGHFIRTLNLIYRNGSLGKRKEGKEPWHMAYGIFEYIMPFSIFAENISCTIGATKKGPGPKGPSFSLVLVLI